MNTSTKTKKVASRGKFFIAALAAAVIGVSSSFAGPADDQIAIQLGAIQSGLNLANATDAQKAQALITGRAQLKLTGIKSATVANDLFRQQLAAATQAALTNPVTLTLTKVAPSGGGKPVSAKLFANKVTAGKIYSIFAKRTPNRVDVIQTAVGAAVNATTVFKYKDATAKLKDAAKIAGSGLTAALKTYPKGTKNWLASQVGTQAGQLPLWDPKKGGNATTAAKLAAAASAVSAHAMLGLGGQANPANVQTVVQELVKAAAKYQKQSFNYAKTPTISATSSGSIGGSLFGIAVEVSGTGADLANWTINPANAVLKGVIAGAIKASKKNYTAIAVGLVTGYVTKYLATTANPISAAQFLADNAASILNEFTGLQPNGKPLLKLKPEQVTALTADINNAITDTFAADAANNNASLAGAQGFVDPTFNNGVSVPVTDTTGI